MISAEGFRRCGMMLVSAGLLLAALVVAASAQSPLAGYESGARQFEEAEFGDLLVYYHQRMIGQAIVEKDQIVYQFDRESHDLVAKKEHWRDDLPDQLPAGMITAGDAASLVEGEIVRSTLYYISPESDVFPIVPAPENPCWVVRHIDDGVLKITVVDAVEARILGNGVPPPYTAFSLTGPWEFGPCSGSWASWMNNAATWFDTMGYSTEAVEWPTQKKVRSHVESGQTAMFYELAHGGSEYFQSGCVMGSFAENTQSSEIETWIANYAKMPFTFIGSCEGMCDTTDGTFSYEFRKGSAESTVTVGYCHMAETYCEICWGNSISWQTALFNRMNQGWTIKDAFDQANADHPSCGNNACMRFAGDPTWAVVPVVARDPWPPTVTVLQPNGGEVLEHDTGYEITWLVTDNSFVDSVTILLSTDGGSTYPDTIAAREYNDSSYVWSVADIDSKTARVRVVATDAGDNTGVDGSDADFTLWGTVSGIELPDLPTRPDEIVLDILGGNPISAGAKVLYGIPQAAHVRLALYDVTGRRIGDLASGYRPEGFHAVGLEDAGGLKLAPGLYFLRLDSAVGTRTIKAIKAD